MTSEPQRTWMAIGAAVAGPVAVAAALTPVRGHTDNTNIALVLVIVVVAVAMLGRRIPVVLSATSAMLAFDFFHTRPYHSFTINAHDDVVTAVLLLVVGIAVGELAIRGRRERATAGAWSDEISRIHATAELVASGEPPDFVVMSTAAELRDLLNLRDCTWEPGWVAHDPHMWHVERDGSVRVGEIQWSDVETMGLPGHEVELVVDGYGRCFGRYLMVPSPGVPVPLERRIVAVALADQVASSFAAHAAYLGS